MNLEALALACAIIGTLAACTAGVLTVMDATRRDDYTRPRLFVRRGDYLRTSRRSRLSRITASTFGVRS